MTKRLLFILLCMLVLFPGYAQDWGNADMAMMIYDLDSCHSIAERNADIRMTPASLIKLVTTATALEKMGGESRISTFVTTDGTIDAKGILRGNLYVRGSLDPTLESTYMRDIRFFSSLIDSLSAKGIKGIDGDIVADGSIVKCETVSPKWLYEDLSTYYGVGCFGISVYDNVQRLNIRSGAVGAAVSYSVEFPETETHIIDHLKVVNGKTYNTHIYTMPYSNDVLVEGEMGKNYLRSENIALTNPVLFMALHLKRRLEDRNITVSGIGREGKALGTTVLYEHRSPMLARIIRDTNCRSNNHYAQHLFRLLGVIGKNGESGATTADAVKVIRNMWSERGVDLSSLLLYDGNGLSPMDAVSVRQMVLLLNYMWRGESNYFFTNSLPICGKEGTVSQVFVNTPFLIRAKSGSMTGVQSYAGYLLSSGHAYSFCIIVNGFSSNRSGIKTMMEESIIKAICNYEDSL